MVKLIFNTGDLRSQVIFVWKSSLMNGAEEWVTFESPFPKIAQVDLGTVLKETSNLVCGGLGLVGSMLTLRHSVPLQNVDPNEIDRPLALISGMRTVWSASSLARISSEPLSGPVVSLSLNVRTGRRPIAPAR
ncbi:MAG TPA: hypothetical protein PKH97_01215 [Tetrasphaera sp.]|uniref:hypothetical protein n=1 Tax=Nostocoides sp. TaxID=1917966 RepID=UPI002B599FCD|nr:hypothetical protein [Tetrasphaera sp.]HNQ05785.1 hypothetical protein [Tetrasphaera sp.]